MALWVIHGATLAYFRRMRQVPLEILALVLPCGQGNFPGIGKLERVLNEIFQTAACSASFGSAWQKNCMSRNYTSFREHFSHNENFAFRTAHAREETLIPRRIVMDRNDLGDFV